jgi:RNA polymerase sigma factor (sigma-70 family)
VSEKEFLSLLNEHQKIIYKLVHLYTSTAEDKKDAYQEIVLQAWKGFPNYKRESKFSTWLYRVCLNTIFTIKKKEKRLEFSDEAHLHELPGYATNLDAAQRLRLAIRSLPETEKAIISLHLDGYDNSEISEIIGITPNLVAVKIFRAKQHLSTLLKNI